MFPLFGKKKEGRGKKSDARMRLLVFLLASTLFPILGRN